MPVKRKRIGLVLASIHTGVALNVWDSFVRTAVNANTSLFIFPGARLNSPHNHEYLRNQVYNLVNSENLDGCISWSSAIAYKQSKEEFEHFHDRFAPLPYVTIGFKVPGSPCVEFDAYNGMKALVTHCIRHHGAKKIAFLPGPDFHSSAHARLKGYNDALKESGITNSPSLISEPSDWSDGEAAAAQLFEGRSLVPGRDFDTLVGSSDLMTLDAINYFNLRGFHIPHDYKAVGFNNSIECFVTESPLTTVHLPYAQMSGESFKIVLDMTGKKKKPAKDIFLNTEVIIRESCGCISRHHQTDRPDELIAMYKKQEQLAIRTRYEKEKCNTVLNYLKCDLLGTRDRHFLVQNLARHLPKIGIHTAGLVLYSDEKTSVFTGGFSREGILPVKEQRFPARLLVPADLKSQFDNGMFLVQPLFIENQSLGYFIHNVSANGRCDGVIYEELRSSVSYALKGIFLLEETVHAKKIAEQAEKAKTEFLQTLEDGMFNPLQGITESLELMEKKIAFSSANTEIKEDLNKLKKFIAGKEAEAGRMMDFTLARIDELTLQKTVFDIEELLPKIGVFPLLQGDTGCLAQCFSLIREQYPASYSAELCHEGLSVTFKKKTPNAGTAAIGSRREKARQFSLHLAERILLMHGGSFIQQKNYCKAMLPWPTLTGHELSKNTVNSDDNVLVLTDPALIPGNFFSLPQITDVENALPGKTAFIVCNAASAKPEDLVKAANLKYNPELESVPFLCYGFPQGAGGAADSAASIIDAINFALNSSKKGTIIFIGQNKNWNERKENVSFINFQNDKKLNTITIDSMSAFDRTVSEVKPLLIIINNLDITSAAAIRQHPLTVMVPIIMVCDKIGNSFDITALGQYSRLFICHWAVFSSKEFQARLQALIGGDEILPPFTGVLVKKAIQYFDQHAESNISRWKLADTVNVSEDYLTRIFHKEMGLSLWDYLNRLRIFRAAELLRMTNEPIQTVALKTGFHDHTYFCRVFKKIYGVPPGKLRK